MNNLMVFENHDVEVFEWNGQVLFNPKHVGDCLGIKNVNDNISKMNNKQVIKLTNSKIGNPDFRKLHNTGENFLTESGVYKLIFKSKKKEAEKFQDWVTDEVLPQIRKTGGYIPIEHEMSDAEIMAKALQISQRTIEEKDKLLKAMDKELIEVKDDLNLKSKFINQIAASQNSLKVEEVAQIASKEGIRIGRNKLWTKLREWGMIKKNSKYDPKQEYIDRGYFEVAEGTRENSKGVFTYKTTRVLGKGQVYIMKRLISERG